MSIMSESAFHRLYNDSYEEFKNNFPTDAMDEIDEQGNTLLMKALKLIIIFGQVADSVENKVDLNMTSMEIEHGPFDDDMKQMLVELPTIINDETLCDAEFQRLFKITALLIGATDNFNVVNKQGENALLLAMLMDRWLVKVWIGDINDYCDMIIFMIEKKMNRKPSARHVEGVLKRLNTDSSFNF